VASSSAVTNNGTITTPPVINATTFINYGTLSVLTIYANIGDWSQILSPLPFETFDTLNYTNYGYMQSYNGFRFDYYPNPTSANPSTYRQMAANFVSMNPGLIFSTDPPASGLYLFNVCAVSVVDPSYWQRDVSGLWLVAGRRIKRQDGCARAQR
jgi:hypothetical protein